MADSDGKEKPNLKICIDNTESDSEDEASLILTDASDVGEGETDHDVDNDQVEFNVRIGKTKLPSSSTTTTKQVVESKFKPTTKKYENKSGEFIVGFDLTDEQLLEKREQRAKRFGIPAKKANKLNVEEIHQSLGVKTDKVDERGLRPEAIHMRGLDDMTTQDVFKYFQEFSPGSIEWIDDASCNVVWMDKSTACRALMKLSRSQQCIEKYIKKNQVKNGKKTEDKDEKERKNQKLKSTNKATEETDDSDDDNLDLTEEPGSKAEKQTVTPMDTTETESETTDKEKTDSSTADDKTGDKMIDAKEEMKRDEEEDMEEGEISSDVDSINGSDYSVSSLFKDVNLSRVIWPPGQWRLGVPCQKSKYLFFRYANKADVKVRGAEKKSKFYVKHGNPNYGGMKGLISNSRKRQHWSRHHKEEQDDDVPELKKIDVKVPKGRELPDYSDVGMFTGEMSIEERESFDRKPTHPAANGSEGEESDNTEDEGLVNEKSSRPALFTKGYTKSYEDRFSPLNLDRFSPLNDDSEAPERGVSDDDSDSNTTEVELQKLLAVPCRSGRMYADDVEEEIKTKVRKRSTDPNDLTVVTDVRDRLSKRHQEPSSTGDARQLITGKGLDLRRRLETKRQKHTQKSSDRDSPDYHSFQIKVYD